MKLKNSLLVVQNLEVSKRFYREILGLRVIADFGANVTLTGGICLQTEESWQMLVPGLNVGYGANDSELYFEEENFDAFLNHLSACSPAYLHTPKEHPWGQRAVRFYDPDRHVIEVGESLGAVCRRFFNNGLSVEEIAKRMEVSDSMVVRLLKFKQGENNERAKWTVPNQQIPGCHHGGCRSMDSLFS